MRLGDRGNGAGGHIFVLIPLLLGAIDFGRGFYVEIEVANAARTAVQYGSQSEAQMQDTANVAAVAKNEAPDVAAYVRSGKERVLGLWLSAGPMGLRVLESSTANWCSSTEQHLLHGC